VVVEIPLATKTRTRSETKVRVAIGEGVGPCLRCRKGRGSMIGTSLSNFQCFL
jgi:hypothetical protein